MPARHQKLQAGHDAAKEALAAAKAKAKATMKPADWNKVYAAADKFATATVRLAAAKVLAKELAREHGSHKKNADAAEKDARQKQAVAEKAKKIAAATTKTGKPVAAKLPPKKLAPKKPTKKPAAKPGFDVSQNGVPDHLREQKAAWSPEQKKAITKYTGEEFSRLNMMLRSGKPVPADLTETDRGLQGAFAVIPPFKEPVTAYRRVNFINPSHAQQYLDQFEKAVTGDGIVVLGGYQSTTLDPKVAGAFNQEEESGVHSVMVQIAARHGLYVDELSDAPGEKELLLNHGQHYRVAGFHDAEFPVIDGGVRKFKVVKLEQL